MISILSILALGLADRVRGSGWFKYGHDYGLVAMGMIVAFMLNLSGWKALYTVAAVAFGGAPGWGNPLGAAYDGRPMEHNNYEWWQVGLLRRSIFAALVARGFLWGVLLLPISIPAAIAFTVAFVVTPYLARWTRMSWGWMEFSRGALVAFLIITMG